MGIKYVCPECGASMALGAKVANVKCPVCRIPMTPAEAAEASGNQAPPSADAGGREPPQTASTKPGGTSARTAVGKAIRDAARIKVAKPVEKTPHKASSDTGARRLSTATPVREAFEKRPADTPRQADMHVAGEAVERIIEAARKEAEQLTRRLQDQAERQSERIVQAAQADAEKILSEAREKAKTEVAAYRERTLAQADNEIREYTQEQRQQADNEIRQYTQARRETAEQDAQELIESARRQSEQTAKEIIEGADMKNQEADRNKQDAARQAEATRKDADKAAEKIRGDARAKADDDSRAAIRKAEEEARKIIDDARQRAGELQEQARKAASETTARAEADAAKIAETAKAGIDGKPADKKKPETADNGEPSAQPAAANDTAESMPSEQDDIQATKAKINIYAKREAKFIMAGMSFSMLILLYCVVLLTTSRDHLDNVVETLTYVVVLINILVFAMLFWIVRGHYRDGKQAVRLHKERMKAKTEAQKAENAGAASTERGPGKQGSADRPKEKKAQIPTGAARKGARGKKNTPKPLSSNLQALASKAQKASSRYADSDSAQGKDQAQPGAEQAKSDKPAQPGTGDARSDTGSSKPGKSDSAPDANGKTSGPDRAEPDRAPAKRTKDDDANGEPSNPATGPASAGQKPDARKPDRH